MIKTICGIYKISFSQTNKIYIGQSVNIHRRKIEHLRSAFTPKDKLKDYQKRDYFLPIHSAMRKYGEQNTFFSIVEECERSELNYKERYWINLFKSDNRSFGYNLSHGGQDVVGAGGELHSQAILTQAQVNEIITELQKSDKTQREIAATFKVKPVTICNINTGKNWFNPNLDYPIRKNSSENTSVKKSIAQKRRLLTAEEALQIRQQYATMCSLQEIYNNFPQLKPDFINSVIYRRESYPEVPFFDRKTQEWYFSK